MANQEIKFTEDELKSLKELQTTYQQKQLQFGQLKVQKLLRTLVKSLNEKYGPGNLDPTTGVFTPTPEKTTETI